MNRDLNVKATDVPEDMKKPYKDVIEEQKRKREEERNKSQVKKVVDVSKSLYPDNPAELQK